MGRTAENLLIGLETFIAVGNFERVIEACKKTLVAARDEGERDVEAASLVGLAIVNRYLGKYEDARIYGDGALNLARHHDLTERIADAVIEIATLKLTAFARHYEARDDLREALYLAHDVGYKRGVTKALCGMSEALIGIGDYQSAAKYAREAVEYALEIEDSSWTAQSLRIVGAAHHGAKQFDKAVEALQHALQISTEQNYQSIEGMTNYDLAWIYANSTRHRDDAETLFANANRIAKNLQWVRLDFLSMYGLGIWHQRREEYELAYNYLNDMIFLAGELHNPIFEAATLVHMGRLHLEVKEYDTAVDRLLQATMVANENHHPEFEAMAQQWLAQGFAKLHEYDNAIESLRKAYDIYISLDNTEAARKVGASLLWMTVLALTDKLLRLVGLRQD